MTTINVGYLESGIALDLSYAEDSAARVDMNVVATREGAIVEVQATAEGEAIPRAEMDKMIDLGLHGVALLTRIQRDALALAGVDLDGLFQQNRGAGAWTAST